MKVEIELTTLNALVAIVKAHRKMLLPGINTEFKTKENTVKYIDKILAGQESEKDWYLFYNSVLELTFVSQIPSTTSENEELVGIGSKTECKLLAKQIDSIGYKTMIKQYKHKHPNATKPYNLLNIFDLNEDVWYVSKGVKEYFISPFKLKSEIIIYTGTRQECKNWIIQIQGNEQTNKQELNNLLKENEEKYIQGKIHSEEYNEIKNNILRSLENIKKEKYIENNYMDR